MATINLGAIKFNWKGAYNNSTAYVVDDVVSSGGSSYVCILASQGNAVSNGTYWNLMAQAGTDGTDVGTTLTTQGDLLYRDGSGLQRLAAGTSGQFLKTQGSGANPVWATNTAGIAQVIQGESSNEFSYNSPSNTGRYFPSSNKLTAQITPSSTSSKILVQFEATIRFGNSTSDAGGLLALKETIGGSSTIITPHATVNYNGGFYMSQSTNGNIRVRLNEFMLRSPNTTSQITYEVGIGGYAVDGTDIKLNDDSSTGRILLMEVTV